MGILWIHHGRPFEIHRRVQSPLQCSFPMQRVSVCKDQCHEYHHLITISRLAFRGSEKTYTNVRCYKVSPAERRESSPAVKDDHDNAPEQSIVRSQRLCVRTIGISLRSLARIGQRGLFQISTSIPVFSCCCLCYTLAVH